jgi:hypothetical protein
MYSLRPTFRRSGSYSLTDCVADFPEEDLNEAAMRRTLARVAERGAVALS